MNEEEKTRLTPVSPRDPEFWTITNSNGAKRIPHRSSRRLKFLGLVERDPNGPYSGRGPLSNDDTYDLAFGPRAPQVRRPLESEWADPFMGESETEALQQVSKQRKSSKRKKRGPKAPIKKKTD